MPRKPQNHDTEESRKVSLPATAGALLESAAAKRVGLPAKKSSTKRTTDAAKGGSAAFRTISTERCTVMYTLSQFEMEHIGQLDLDATLSFSACAFLAGFAVNAYLILASVSQLSEAKQSVLHATVFGCTLGAVVCLIYGGFKVYKRNSLINRIKGETEVVE